jgi:glycosyltransferase involved in cell wall biosynthesis
MKVSVLVMTHDHAPFIAQALDSALAQETPFPCEIVVSEDASTDGTREIVLEYARRHPDRIRLLLSEHNLRSNRVVARGIEAARGEYVALLDGDDYWTDPAKLRKQAGFLDAHPECAVCFHNATVVHEDGSRPPRPWTPPDQKPIATLEDIWCGNFIATCSTMFRRGLLGPLPPWYDAFFPITDWPLHILNAERGAIGYLNEVMGVYRHHSGGLYSPFSEERKLQETLRFLETMNRNLEYRHDRLARTAISKYFVEWAEEYLARGDVARARACFRTALTRRPWNRHVSLGRLWRLAARLYRPGAMGGGGARAEQHA